MDARTRLSGKAYNSVGQIRADAWSNLQEEAARLAGRRAQGLRTDRCVTRIRGLMAQIGPFEQSWAFPGRHRFEQIRKLLDSGDYDRFARVVTALNRALITDSFRTGAGLPAETAATDAHGISTPQPATEQTVARPYFEVLVVETMTPAQEQALRAELRALRRPEDEFVYEIVVVPSFEDAVTAVTFNFALQACVIRSPFDQRSRYDMSRLSDFVNTAVTEAEDTEDEEEDRTPDERAQALGSVLKEARPELDLYLMTAVAVEQIAGRLSQNFRRVFHAREGSLELHLSILQGIAHRYDTPFFEALRQYSRKPTGVFHALPISRGNSVAKSHWIQDMLQFYGLDVFLAETSATGGGLDSLLEPTGPLREAQKLAAETFGARQTYFVTNGTSTANKIVVQALVRPGDIVLVDRNCHQSHHYGLMQSGARVDYLEAYPLSEYSIYGAVPVREIKRQLLALRQAGKLDRVRMIMLTNCTFDGVVYDVQRVMEECLAIKPDLIFLWDEAWFAFARFHPVYRKRTGMASARALLERIREPGYRERNATAMVTEDATDEELLDRRLMPDPARARVRVYATQSTHKTLTSLRQGSMIHVFDQEFAQKAEETFHEAYMAHTSTSPNYQILASLDLGRRQAALECFELVQRQVEYAMSLRDAIDNHPLLSKYMRCLSTADLIPREFRPTGIDAPLRAGLTKMTAAWEQDEFVLDPSRITLYIGATGIDGDTFKREHLMDRFDVQINKTSRNSVLFMTNIGTTRSSVAYLIEALVNIARDIDERVADMGPLESAAHERTVARLTNPTAELPDFSAFHESFRFHADGEAVATPEGDLRRAFFLAYDDTLCEYLQPDEILEKLEAGQPVVSATFVTPYPPGFPVLVPGQEVSRQILAYMYGLDTKEIHGLRPQLGYRVFIEKALQD